MDTIAGMLKRKQDQNNLDEEYYFMQDFDHGFTSKEKNFFYLFFQSS